MYGNQIAVQFQQMPGDPVSRLTLAIVIAIGLASMGIFSVLLAAWHCRLARMEKSLEKLASEVSAKNAVSRNDS